MPIKSRTIELSIDNRKERLVLPVNPQEIAIDTASLNQHVQLLTVGEANLLGPRGLASTSLSGFFPAQGSPFYRFADPEPAVIRQHPQALAGRLQACAADYIGHGCQSCNGHREPAIYLPRGQPGYLVFHSAGGVPPAECARPSRWQSRPSGPPLRWYPAPIRCAPATVCGRSPSGTMAMGPSGSVSITPTGLRYAILT